MGIYNSNNKSSYGYFRVASCVPKVNVADVAFNVENIVEQVRSAESQGVDLIVFPELSITALISRSFRFLQ